ncbi:hypothetical protein BXY85_0908 [Roseivirga pacifica]|uniref:Uncharacterized protein n=2 Tax=Roseivirga pacifica TaxID=1267423 RepID=A0A1I0RN19_9BACT|nr:hypothetical protein [Roseivirga pacifica]RKQ49906.1 hypothetical protein BXY85_0908 [Roseivirga pacifica]SEW42579.1 hypothetical protein SAMN05216290_3856 [Roseivirga pacifica]
MVKFGTSRRLKRSDIWTYVMEVFIVIFGITVAYQLNVYYDDKKDLRLENAAIEKLHNENELNLTTFESLIDERLQIEDDTRELARILYAGQFMQDDSLALYLFEINQTYKPLFQIEAINFYLNTNYTNKNSDLKNELITLKSNYLQLRDVVEYYVRMKEKYYNDFLVSDVDFGEEKILSLDRIKSVEFKNLVVNLLANEIELNALFDKTYGMAIRLDDLIDRKLR